VAQLTWPRNFSGVAEFSKSAGRRSGVSSPGLMLTLLEYLAASGIVLVSLGGFAAALLWTSAIWFDQN
jgi:hypothetical protein